MKYTYIGPNRVDELGKEWPANCYGGQSALNGEDIELDGFLAKKADLNPNYKKKAKPGPKPKNIEELQPQVATDDGLSVD